MSAATPNVAASVRARLLNVAKAQGVDFNQVLVRFALERILYRLTQSPHADRFLLKGALLFTLWYDMPHRATRDADLLGFGASDLESVAQVFRDIAAVPVDDGIVFDPASVTVEEIRKEACNGYDLLVMSNPFTRGLEVMRNAVAKVTEKPFCDVLLVMPSNAMAWSFSAMTVYVG